MGKSEQRSYSLDALRGYAIVTMVLSAQIIASILPEWMSHAQEPPNGGFCADVYGITWVDLVFPFFLFSMGAAFPFYVGRRIEQGQKSYSLVFSAFQRYLKLAFFAIFIYHLYPFSISSPQDEYSWIMSLIGFALLFITYTRFPFKMKPWVYYFIELLGYAVSVLVLINIHYANGRQFSLSYSNIIILVLANMAFFGTLIYIYTKNTPLIRVAILPFIMAILLSTGGWQNEVLTYSPFSWLFQFRFLKYLFIVIPGSIAGEYLREWIIESKNEGRMEYNKSRSVMLAITSILIIVINLCGLFGRFLIENLILSSALIIFMYSLTKNCDSYLCRLWRRLLTISGYLLILGLFFENFEGGIRKDPSTFSYYFVTAGLACYALLAFHILCDVFKYNKILSPIIMAGQNPMIAYVTTGLFILPFMKLTNIYSIFVTMESEPILGFARGVIITSLATIVAMFFTKIKWFWRT